MSERRFFLCEVESDKWIFKAEAITEDEFLNRINHVRNPEFITGQQAIDIMIHGCKEKEVDHD